MLKKIIIAIVVLFIFPLSTIEAKQKFLSLKKDKVNVRYGPTFESPIKFIYKKINLPVVQIDKKGNWRRIIDLKNNSGWIHWSQLKPSNSIIILENKLLFKGPSNFSKPVARLEKGRLLIIKKCQKNWCNVNTDDYSGWIKSDKVWGSTN